MNPTPPEPPLGHGRLAFLGLLGALLLWAAHPPLGLTPLAWIAPWPWLLLVAAAAPPRRRGYLWLWIAGGVHWLVMLQGIRLAHPALYAAWIALGLYAGIYLPLFVSLARVGIHRYRWPLWIAAPAIWVGLETIRGYALTGFSAGMLGHTQADVAMLIQIADAWGTYGVSFVVMLVSAAAFSLAAAWLPAGRAGALAGPLVLAAPRRGAACAAAVLLLTLGYGAWRLQQPESRAANSDRLRASLASVSAADSASAEGLVIALIQRNEPIVFDLDASRELEIFDAYLRGTLDAMRHHPEVDLVIWPESMFSGALPLMLLDDDASLPGEAATAGISQEEFVRLVRERGQDFQQRAARVQQLAAQAAGREEGPELLVGCGVVRYGPERPESSCGVVHVAGEGRVGTWYGKRHLVMFGEYIPLGDWLPWLYDLTPLPYGVTPGEGPVAVEVGGLRIAPNICFETMVERYTQRQLRQLADQGTPADLIVNVTNDAWFRGSAILDHHRRCSQLVAVGNRRPLVIAANTGPTVWIDGSGRIAEAIPHQTDGHLIATPTTDGRWGLYQWIGDWPARALALLCGVAAVSAWRGRRESRST